MEFDIETTIQDNIRLKKALQMSKFTNQKLQKQFKDLKQFYEDEISRNNQLKLDYAELQRKYQQSFTESMKDNNSLISQIQDLKKIIDEKQRDMQQLQIKLIPSLDQDMLRVKLITQMEGPYQQTVDRKDRQIDKLKNKISELERNLEITGLGLKTKVETLKKENNQIKSRYEEQNNRLMQQLNLALSRNECLSVQGSIIKNQKKQIQQLKVTQQFIRQNEQKHIEQIKELRNQRKVLLQKLMQLNSKEALLLEGRHNLTEMQKIKQQRLRLLKQNQTLKVQKQKLSRQLAKNEQQKNKLSNQHERQINEERMKFNGQRNQLNSQIYNLKQEIRRLRNSTIQGQTGRQSQRERIRRLEKQLYEKSAQLEVLRLENSRYTQRGSEPGCFEGFCPGVRPPQEFKQNDNTMINKNKYDSRQMDKAKKQIIELKRQNEKLKKKLAVANQKILELIRDKMKYNQNISPQRERTHSNIDKPIGVFLQYEDCSFKPLVQPTLYTYHATRK